MSQGLNPLWSVMCGLPPSSNIKTIPANDANTGLPPEYPEAIGGMYSDNIITPEQIKEVYYQQIIQGYVSQPTPLSEAILHPQNIENVRLRIEKNIREYTEDPYIRYLLTREFAQTVIDQIRNNSFLAYEVKTGLNVLNNIIVHHETQIALLSLRHTKRFERWALNNDRIKIMPYGLGDHTLHTKGENQVTPSGYLMNHPFQSQHQAYLRDVLHIQCPSNSQAPCRIPPFPKQFASP